MSYPISPITDDDLHAYADGRLDPVRRDAVDAWLAAHPDRRLQVDSWRDQSDQLHRAYDSVLNEVIPSRLMTAARSPSGYFELQRVATVAWLTVGLVLGYGLHELAAPAPMVDRIATLPRQAAVAHVVYVPEVKHPVEVRADQEAHLVGWLSKRLGSPLRVPKLDAAGYRLVGGRLLPGDAGGVAQLMYENDAKNRLTLYVQPQAKVGQPSPGERSFRYAREGDVDVFYWVEGAFGYALSGNTGRDDMLRLATLVYRQLPGGD